MEAFDGLGQFRARPEHAVTGSLCRLAQRGAFEVIRDADQAPGYLGLVLGKSD
ncbi:MAG: hypothetical protein ABWY13_04085 [Mesorhizobium sp.]|jgi:hypothetical protein